jgi:xylitol oxidase
MTITTPLRNWSGNIEFSTSRLHRPQTVEELQQLVAGSSSIRALGTGHSFNSIADTTGELVSVAELTSAVTFDDATGVLGIPAGARYGDILPHLADHGRALPNLGSLPHISVAGAAATGTHGSGRRNRCLATSVVEVQFVRADGELVTVTADDPDFAGSVLSLGALGITTRMGLATRPAFAMRQQVWLEAPLDGVLAHFDEILDSAYSVSILGQPGRRDVIDQIWVKAAADAALPDGRAWGAVPAEEPVHMIGGQDARACTPQDGTMRPWSEILPHFRIEFTPSSGDEQQSEYFVGRDDGAAAVAAVRALDLDEALQVMEIRTIAADGLWLSPFRDRDTVALHFTWHNRDDKVQRACAAVEAALRPFDVRPHWGKVHGFTPDAVRAHVPGLEDFRALIARHDPERKFGNRFLADFVY